MHSTVEILLSYRRIWCGCDVQKVSQVDIVGWIGMLWVQFIETEKIKGFPYALIYIIKYNFYAIKNILTILSSPFEFYLIF